MTITTYTDKEIAQAKQLATMTATAKEYQRAADKMAWDHKVVDALRQQLAETMKDAQKYRWLRDNSASISWNPSRFNAEIVSGFSHAGTGYLGFDFEDAINAAMGDAND